MIVKKKKEKLEHVGEKTTQHIFFIFGSSLLLLTVPIVYIKRQFKSAQLPFQNKFFSQTMLAENFVDVYRPAFEK
jgi:hypothetical protein